MVVGETGEDPKVLQSKLDTTQEAYIKPFSSVFLSQLWLKIPHFLLGIYEVVSCILMLTVTLMRPDIHSAH